MEREEYSKAYWEEDSKKRKESHTMCSSKIQAKRDCTLETDEAASI